MNPKDIKIKDYLYNLATSEMSRARDTNGDLKSLITLFADKFDDIKLKIDEFPTLVDVDEVPPEFLAYLGQLVGYNLDYRLPIPPQREAIKRAIHSYMQKGTPNSILEILAPYDGIANIYEPYKDIFRYQTSRYSSKHRYPSRDYYNYGVYEVQSYADNLKELRPQIKAYRPAGKRLWFNQRMILNLDEAIDSFYRKFSHRFDSQHTQIYLDMESPFLETLEHFTNNVVIREFYSDAQRKAIGSPLYTAEDLLEDDPNYKPGDTIYALKPFIRSLYVTLEAPTTLGQWIPTTDHVVIMEFEAKARNGEVAGTNIVRTNEFGVQDAQRKATGSPLYTAQDLLDVGADHDDTIYLLKPVTLGYAIEMEAVDDTLEPDTNVVMGVEMETVFNSPVQAYNSSTIELQMASMHRRGIVGSPLYTGQDLIDFYGKVTPDMNIDYQRDVEILITT